MSDDETCGKCGDCTRTEAAHNGCDKCKCADTADTKTYSIKFEENGYPADMDFPTPKHTSEGRNYWYIGGERLYVDEWDSVVTFTRKVNPNPFGFKADDKVQYHWKNEKTGERSALGPQSTVYTVTEILTDGYMRITWKGGMTFGGRGMRVAIAHFVPYVPPPFEPGYYRHSATRTVRQFATERSASIAADWPDSWTRVNVEDAK